MQTQILRLQPFTRPIMNSLSISRWIFSSFACLCLSAILLTGCASTTEPFIPAPFAKPARPAGMDSEAATTLAASAEQTEAPHETAFYKTPAAPKAGRATAGRPGGGSGSAALTVIGSRAYLGSGPRLLILDVSQPAAPRSRWKICRCRNSSTLSSPPFSSAMFPWTPRF